MIETGEHHLKRSKADSEGQKLYFLSHMWNIALTQMQNYYETLVTLSKIHSQEGKSKRWKIRT
jgi:hypothetical protein